MTDTTIASDYSHNALKAGIIGILDKHSKGDTTAFDVQDDINTFLRDLVSKDYLICASVPRVTAYEKGNKIQLSSDDKLLLSVLGELFEK